MSQSNSASDNRSKPTYDYEVIIVGAGPTGVVAANLLGRYGVRTLIVDRQADVMTIPRAVGICEEGSRILDAAGLLSGSSKSFHVINSIQFINEHLQPKFHADADWRKDGHRAIRMFHQPDLERDMRKALLRYPNVELRVSTELKGFSDSPEGVSVLLSDGVGEQSLRCRYLIASDGASSEIRKTLDIGFSGSTYEQDWVILDIENNPLPGNDVAFSINPERPSVTMPGPNGRRRWEFVVKDDDDVEAIFDDSNIMRLLAPWGAMPEVTIARKAVYTFHARTAERYQKGNVFLVGDAAHVTPPFAGQGMMAGLRDAYNLSWKLAAVLQGNAGRQLLASYEVERIPQSKQIIGFAQFIGGIVLPQKKFPAAVRDGVFKILGWLGVHSKTQGLPIRKLPNHINGSLLRHFFISKFKKLGTELPQFDLETCCGRRLASDEIFGCEFRVVGWNTDPSSFLEGNTQSRWHAMGGQLSTLASDEQFSTKSDLVLDRAQHYREVFGHGERVLVMRPDKMVVINCRPARLDRALNEYIDSIGAAECAA